MDTNANNDDIHGHPLIDMMTAMLRLNSVYEQQADSILDPDARAALDSGIEEINIMFEALKIYTLNRIVEGTAFAPPSPN
jgi:hypothetical protein